MKVISCGRNDCLLENGQRLRGEALRANYVCRDCGGTLELQLVMENYIVVGQTVNCGSCGGDDFISVATLRRQLVAEVEVIAGLPRELQQIAGAVQHPRIIANTVELSSLLF